MSLFSTWRTADKPKGTRRVHPICRTAPKDLLLKKRNTIFFPPGRWGNLWKGTENLSIFIEVDAYTYLHNEFIMV
ncbi:MAG: hypothetical protein QG657_930 [Acidobacteriota bacterium]|nr:hypothetical protein [Acidobacteriota bacterium]